MQSPEILNMWIYLKDCLNIFLKFSRIIISSKNKGNYIIARVIIKSCHWAYNTYRHI